MDIDIRAIPALVFGLPFLAALVLYFGWRATILSLAAFALWLRAISMTDFPPYAAFPLVLTLLGIVCFTEMHWRRKAFQSVAKVLGATWTSNGYLHQGEIAGIFNGRKYRVYLRVKGEGHSSEGWTIVTIDCASGGWDFSLPGDSIRLFGSKWLARRRQDNLQEYDAAKRRLYGDLAILRSRQARHFHQGTLASGGYGLEWECSKSIGFGQLPATLKCLDAIAGKVERGPAGRFQGPTSPVFIRGGNTSVTPNPSLEKRPTEAGHPASSVASAQTLGPVKILRWIAGFICSSIILIVGIYTTIAICVASFIVLGRITPGEVMIFDTNTPTLIQTLVFVVIGSLVIAGCAVIRSKLGRSMAQQRTPADTPGPAGSVDG